MRSCTIVTVIRVTTTKPSHQRCSHQPSHQQAPSSKPASYPALTRCLTAGLPPCTAMRRASSAQRHHPHSLHASHQPSCSVAPSSPAMRCFPPSSRAGTYAMGGSFCVCIYSPPPSAQEQCGDRGPRAPFYTAPRRWQEHCSGAQQVVL